MTGGGPVSLLLADWVVVYVKKQNANNKKTNASTGKKQVPNCEKTNSVLVKMNFYNFWQQKIFLEFLAMKNFIRPYKIVAGPEILKIFFAPKNCKISFLQVQNLFFRS